MFHALRGNNTSILIFASIATALVTVDLACISVALPRMLGFFSASKIEIAWVITVYSISTAICIPLLGYLSEKVGRKKTYLVGIVGFSLFSALSGLSQNLDQILIFRTLQGAFSAPLVALSQSIIIHSFPEKERGKAISWWTLGLLIGPLIGPILGGYLTEYYNWRWVFLINVPIGVIALIGCYFSLEENNINKNTTFAFKSFAFLAIGASCMQVFLDRGQILDWFSSSLISTLAVLTFIFILLFLIQFFIKNSKTLFPKDLFKDANYVGGLIFTFLFGIILVPPFIMIPDFLDSLGGYPVDKIGLVLTFSGVGGLIGTLISSRILVYEYYKTFMFLGLLIYMFGQYQMSLWTSDISIYNMMINGVIRGIGIGFFYPAMATATYITLPAQLRDHGASLFQFVRNAGSAIAIAILVVLMDRYNKININELSSRITSSYQNNEAINNSYPLSPLAEGNANYFLNLISQESHMISLINIFILLALLPLLFFPFFLLFKTKK